MFGLFKKRVKFDEGKKSQFIEAVAGMLQLQLATVTCYSIESADGSLKPKAIGYVYGFIDAALRTIGQDMSDVSGGRPGYVSCAASHLPWPRGEIHAVPRRHICRSTKPSCLAL